MADTGKNRASNITVTIILILLPVLTWLFYSGLFVSGRLRTGGEPFNYFKDLAGSFAHGRLDIDRASGEKTADLAFYNNKFYLYWPPVPALVYMGLNALGNPTQDNLIAASFGALNTTLVILLFFVFSKKYGMGLKPLEVLFLAVFWSFGTVHFYMSMLGSVWYISQVMAQTFLLASILFMLGRTSPMNLLLSSLFFSAAVYTRNDLIFSIFLLAAIHIKNRGKDLIKNVIVDSLAFALPFVCASAWNMAYNAARFDGRVFDNGINYCNIHLYFMQNVHKHGVTSFLYIPQNLYSEVFKPMPLSVKFPFFLYGAEGFGFLWASPLFFFIFPAAYFFLSGAENILAGRTVIAGRLEKYDLIAMAAAAISGAATAAVILMMVGNGWIQFASRYSLDFQLMAVIFMVFILKIWRGKYFYTAAAILLALSVYIQYHGVKYFVQG